MSGHAREEWLADERRGRIRELLALQGKVRAQHLVQLFGVSEDTIRRDLTDMAEQGLLRRVHGGALPLTAASVGGSWQERVGRDAAEKQALVAAVLRELRGGERIFLDSGTTNALLARQLPRALPFTVVTTSPEAALALCDHERCDVIVPGGRLHRRTASFCGAEAVRMVEAMYADVCLLGVCAVSADGGLTCEEFDEMAVKQAMLRRAERRLALVSTGKLGARLPWQVADVGVITRLFTTADETEPALQAIGRLGVPVSCVEMG
ncbi:DeoR/GlpR family DNA-binding transcription regulator [Caldimonas brevitalea]|uniref:Transcriptional regulator n=1 Tax=Caldimonas brevitalea TaxID=413882 RepID=A0A0G3BMC7_9BURK|nr:DeoR/GlpR family DNA-binding transcription regulator [Caldimonas brevitalea]AKJ27710.1 transcriptional regulator [Caldimonas brevitalea]